MSGGKRINNLGGIDKRGIDNTSGQELKPREEDFINKVKCFLGMKKYTFKEQCKDFGKRIAKNFGETTELDTFFQETFPELANEDPEDYKILLAIEVLYPGCGKKLYEIVDEAGYDNLISDGGILTGNDHDIYSMGLLEEILNKKIQESFVIKQFKEIVFCDKPLQFKKDHIDLLLKSSDSSTISKTLLRYRAGSEKEIRYKLDSSIIRPFPYKELTKDKITSLGYTKEQYKTIKENYFTIWFNHYKNKYGEDVANKYLYFAYWADYNLPTEQREKIEKNEIISLSITENDLKEISEEYELSQEEQEKIVKRFNRWNDRGNQVIKN